MIIQELSDILEVSLHLDPRVVLLGIPNDVVVPRFKLLFSLLGIVVTKRDVANYWGVP